MALWFTRQNRDYHLLPEELVAVLARSDVIEVCDDSNPKTLEFQK
jgi:hypothetical protein